MRHQSQPSPVPSQPPCRVLLVVEPEFLSKHVGVRRVIVHYWRALETAGCEVTPAMPDGRGDLLAGRVEGMAGEADASPGATLDPSWTSRERRLREPPPSGATPGPVVRWTDALVDPGSFDLTVLSNPWLCALGVPTGGRMVGIIYDMVPNLLALGALRMPVFTDVHDFAHEHDVGHRFMLAHADRVLCISQSTRDDFHRLYGRQASGPGTFVDIPYDLPEVGPRLDHGRPAVLMVNALDPRKNFSGAAKALLRVAERRSFSLHVVGRERIPLPEALGFLEAVAAAGLDVQWHREAGDAQLCRLYDQASVLLFPSFYEGLGLPILEAQAHGLPVISSDVSSCPEVNMNRDLCVAPHRPDEIAARLEDVLDGRATFLQGAPLRASLASFLGERSRGAAAFAVD